MTPWNNGLKGTSRRVIRSPVAARWQMRSKTLLSEMNVPDDRHRPANNKWRANLFSSSSSSPSSFVPMIRSGTDGGILIRQFRSGTKLNQSSPSRFDLIAVAGRISQLGLS